MSHDELQADVILKTPPTNGNSTTAQNVATTDCCDSLSDHELVTLHHTITDASHDLETKPTDEEANVLKAHNASGIGRHLFGTDRTKEPTNVGTKKVMKRG